MKMALLIGAAIFGLYVLAGIIWAFIGPARKQDLFFPIDDEK